MKQSEDDEKGELTGDERSTAQDEQEKSEDENESEGEAQKEEVSKESGGGRRNRW